MKVTGSKLYATSGPVTMEACYMVERIAGLPATIGSAGEIAVGIAAKWTGEKRPPRKGEFYLSGAIPVAYRAPNDLDTPYLIARLVRVETRYVVEETPFEP